MEAFKALCGFVPSYTWKWCQTGHLQGGSRFPARPRCEDGRWLCSLGWLGFGSLEGLAPGFASFASEFHEVIAREGRVAPHTDPELKRKTQRYARLVRDMSLRGLVSFGAPSEATVGFFVVPKKLGETDAFFLIPVVESTLSTAMALCAACSCILVGSQFPKDSAYHMAQTDVNTAFYRILAPSGMSEYFILPSVSTELLLREGVKVPDHLRRLSHMSPQLQVLAIGFFLGLSVSVRRWWRAASEQLVFGGRIAHGSSMTRDSICFGFYVDGVCAVGCDRPRVLTAMEAVKGDVGRFFSCSVLRLRLIHPGKFSWRLSWITSPGILSLDPRVSGGLRYGLEFAARQKQLTGDQVAKLIGHITWRAVYCVVLLCLSSMLGIVLHVHSDNLASPWSPWVCAADASGSTWGHGVTRRWCDPLDAAAAGSCAERWRFSAKEFISARRSVLIENERKTQKATWRGVERHTRI